MAGDCNNILLCKVFNIKFSLLSVELFWATVCKTVRPILSDRCHVCPVVAVCCPVGYVCNVGVLLPNGWTDQDETWHAGRPRPGHIALDGNPGPPPPKGHSPQFSAHICCGKMAAWIKMPLGMEVGLSPGDFVLDGDPGPLPQKGAEPQIFGPFLLWPNGWMDQDGTWQLAWR